MFGNIVVDGGDYCPDSGLLEPVLEIVRLQLTGCRYGYRAELMQGKHGEPELVVSLEDEHYAVALFDAKSLEIVGALGGIALHLSEREPSFHAVFVNVYHGEFVSLALGDSVHDIEREVEFILVLEADLLKQAVLVRFGLDELVDGELSGLGL